MLQKFKLIMWLTDIEWAGLAVIYPMVDCEGKSSGVVAVIEIIFSQLSLQENPFSVI